MHTQNHNEHMHMNAPTDLQWIAAQFLQALKHWTYTEQQGRHDGWFPHYTTIFHLRKKALPTIPVGELGWYPYISPLYPLCFHHLGMFWHVLPWWSTLTLLFLGRQPVDTFLQDLKADFADALDNAKPVIVKASFQADFNLISSHQGVDQIIG